MNPPEGCPFHPRCPHAQARCRTEKPVLRELDPGQFVACHFAETIPVVALRVPVKHHGRRVETIDPSPAAIAARI